MTISPLPYPTLWLAWDAYASSTRAEWLTASLYAVLTVAAAVAWYDDYQRRQRSRRHA